MQFKIKHGKLSSYIAFGFAIVVSKNWKGVSIEFYKYEVMIGVWKDE